MSVIINLGRHFQSPQPAAAPMAPAGRTPLLVLISLNVIDLSLTMFALTLPGFIEVNPLMAVLSPVGMAALKIVGVAVGICILWALWRHRLARLACVSLCGVYGCVMLLWVGFFAIRTWLF